jgi:hypothetical protein
MMTVLVRQQPKLLLRDTGLNSRRKSWTSVGGLGRRVSAGFGGLEKALPGHTAATSVAVSAESPTLEATHPGSASMADPGVTADSRLATDVMSPDSPPDEMSLPLPPGVTERKGGSTVRRPRHLEDAGCSLDTVDPKALRHAPAGLAVLHELGHGRQEGHLLRRGQPLEVGPKPWEPRKARQGLSGQATPSCGLGPSP